MSGNTEETVNMYFGIFCSLCEAGFVDTAQAMVEEVWKLHTMASDEPPDGLTDAVAPLRSLMMLMTSDLDGDQFEKWNQSFHSDKEAFRDKVGSLVVMWNQRLRPA